MTFLTPDAAATQSQLYPINRPASSNRQKTWRPQQPRIIFFPTLRPGSPFVLRLAATCFGRSIAVCWYGAPKSPSNPACGSQLAAVWHSCISWWALLYLQWRGYGALGEQVRLPDQARWAPAWQIQSAIYCLVLSAKGHISVLDWLWPLLPSLLK